MIEEQVKRSEKKERGEKTFEFAKDVGVSAICAKLMAGKMNCSRFRPYHSIDDLMEGKERRIIGCYELNRMSDGGLSLTVHPNLSARFLGPRSVIWKEIFSGCSHHGFGVSLKEWHDPDAKTEFVIGFHFSEGKGNGFVPASGSDPFEATTTCRDRSLAYVSKSAIVSNEKTEYLDDLGAKHERYACISSDYSIEKETFMTFLKECKKALGERPEDCGFDFLAKDKSPAFSERGEAGREAMVRKIWWSLYSIFEYAISVAETKNKQSK